MNPKVLSVSYGNVKNKLAEKIYLNTSLDYTRPTQVYACLLHRCNSKCKMCDYWRSENPSELPATDWIVFLKSLNEFNHNFNINFSGGEPLLKRDFIEILEFCSKENIPAGFVTNGLLLKKATVDKLLSLNLFNINISIDSMNEETNDNMRGLAGILKIVKQNISYLSEARIRQNNKTSVIIKPTVCNQNIKDLPDIVQFAHDMKLTGVNFQPLFIWSEDSKSMFNVDPKELDDMIEKLVIMKKQGYSILNSESMIRDWKLHFQGIKPERRSKCVVALRNLDIQSNGDILLCGFTSSRIGNIRDGNIKSIWTSMETKKLRKNLVNCTKLCTAACVVQRSWMDYFSLLKKMAGN